LDRVSDLGSCSVPRFGSDIPTPVEMRALTIIRLLSLSEKPRPGKAEWRDLWSLSSTQSSEGALKRRSDGETCQPAEAGSTLPITHADGVLLHTPVSLRERPYLTVTSYYHHSDSLHYTYAETCKLHPRAYQLRRLDRQRTR